MSTERFTAFFQTLEHILKNIKRIAASVMQTYGLRSVHTSCLLAFANAPEGLTVTELSRECMIDKALSSRIVKELSEGDFLYPSEKDAQKNYNKRYLLTSKSHGIIRELDSLITDYVTNADENVAEEDREIFYRVLKHFDRSIESILEQTT